MTIARFSLAALFATAPLAGILMAGTSACVLDDQFLSAREQFACTTDADCSEPGFSCWQGLCRVGEETYCADEDKDGYGANENRKLCKFPQRDKDDACAACTPIAKEV